VLRAERWTQSSEITTKRDLREQGVHGLQETPRSLPSVTLWEDTLRYVNRRSLARDEAERWFRKRTGHAKTLLPRRGNDRTHFTVWRLTWPGIKASSLQSRWRSWCQKWKIISIFFSYMRNSALTFRTFFTVRRDIFNRDFKRRDRMSIQILQKGNSDPIGMLLPI